MRGSVPVIVAVVMVLGLLSLAVLVRVLFWIVTALVFVVVLLALGIIGLSRVTELVRRRDAQD